MLFRNILFERDLCVAFSAAAQFPGQTRIVPLTTQRWCLRKANFIFSLTEHIHENLKPVIMQTLFISSL